MQRQARTVSEQQSAPPIDHTKYAEQIVALFLDSLRFGSQISKEAITNYDAILKLSLLASFSKSERQSYAHVLHNLIRHTGKLSEEQLEAVKTVLSMLVRDDLTEKNAINADHILRDAGLNSNPSGE